MVCLCPGAAVVTCRLGGLTQKCPLSQSGGQKSDVKVAAGPSSLWDPGEGPSLRLLVLVVAASLRSTVAGALPLQRVLLSRGLLPVCLCLQGVFSS